MTPWLPVEGIRGRSERRADAPGGQAHDYGLWGMVVVNVLTMERLRESWFWIAVGVLFVWMYTRMHGAHGHGSGHGADTAAGVATATAAG